MFALVTGRSVDEAWAELRKIRTNNERVKRIRKALRECSRRDDLKERVRHFVSAFKILTDNRNLLDHSNIFEITKEPISLYKYDRDGKTIHTVVTLEEPRKVADDMRRFYDYGVMLANSIGLEAAGSTLLPPASLVKPPLPRKLDYTPAPIALSRTRKQRPRA